MPFPPHIQLPPEIQESQEITLTCLLNFSCNGYQIQLQWFLEGDLMTESVVTLTSLVPDSVFTRSELRLRTQWSHHGKNVTCQLHDAEGKVLSKDTVQLNVKRESPQHSYGKGKVFVTFSPAPQGSPTQDTGKPAQTVVSLSPSHTDLPLAPPALSALDVPQLKINVTPSEPTVREGDSVTMTCEVSSSNPDYRTVSWRKDGVLLEGQNTLTLRLPEVTKHQSGTYCCQASNDVGTGMSGPVVLQVQCEALGAGDVPEPSSVQIFLSPAVEGNEVKFLCKSQANPPPTNYTWYHNGKEVQGRTEGTFRIPKALPWHAGTYSCVAENLLGTGQRGPGAELDVQCAQILSISDSWMRDHSSRSNSPKEVTTVIQNPTAIREGDTVTVSCNYSSSNPGVTWYEWRTGSTQEESSSGVLKIQNIAWNNNVVSCAACNHWCSWGSQVTLNVQYAPRGVWVRKIKPLSEIYSGNSVSLQCGFASSHPKEVHFLWKKNGNVLGEESELNFDSISPEDAGSYSCWVKNSVGQTASEPWPLQVLCEWGPELGSGAEPGPAT
ncbi:B-cell receptor cd22 [Saguinus oedipus]|uniref:B-cell receptor cd22 n=1 Tax=Saguinus oedipus TaxID=9490 RepID=A0ABQ9TUC2_SAGOE|nr:B-cell receptor cd22 [Saguinus oedipus]